MPRGRYAENNSAGGQNWYSVDPDWGVLDRVHVGVGATWRIRLNRLSGSDAALRQITLTILINQA